MYSKRRKIAAHTVVVVVLIAAAFCGVTWPRVAFAQARSGRKVIRLEAIKVEGRIQKPQAFYILQRSNLNFEGLELRQSFVPKIIQSIEERPF